MKFTIQDIADNKQLRNFIRTRITTEDTILQDNYLFNLYDTSEIIKILKGKIAKHSKGTNSTRFIPAWEQHIKSLQELENENKRI